VRPTSTAQPTGGLVSADAANAAAALRRVGYDPTPGLIRQVLRAKRAVGEIAETDYDEWDRLIRELPLGLKRAPKVAAQRWRVTS
jgi:hypothetical protein